MNQLSPYIARISNGIIKYRRRKLSNIKLQGEIKDLAKHTRISILKLVYSEMIEVELFIRLSIA